MLQYEVVQIESIANCTKILNQFARNGWRLVQVVGASRFYYIFLERELEQTLEK